MGLKGRDSLKRGAIKNSFAKLQMNNIEIIENLDTEYAYINSTLLLSSNNKK
jgi:hypothetical protein